MRMFAALNDNRLRLVEMLARRGVRLADEDYYAAALATRRCVFCPDKAQCDAWLASGSREGFERFCPNADFIELRSTLRGR